MHGMSEHSGPGACRGPARADARADGAASSHRSAILFDVYREIWNKCPRVLSGEKGGVHLFRGDTYPGQKGGGTLNFSSRATRALCCIVL